jgi:hypothetical protein
VRLSPSDTPFMHHPQPFLGVRTYTSSPLIRPHVFAGVRGRPAWAGVKCQRPALNVGERVEALGRAAVAEVDGR